MILLLTSRFFYVRMSAQKKADCRIDRTTALDKSVEALLYNRITGAQHYYTIFSWFCKIFRSCWVFFIPFFRFLHFLSHWYASFVVLALLWKFSQGAKARALLLAASTNDGCIGIPATLCCRAGRRCRYVATVVTVRCFQYRVLLFRGFPVCRSARRTLLFNTNILCGVTAI